MALIKLENIHKSFGANPVLTNVNIEFAAGEAVVLLGPSGSGKTTILRLIAGFLSPDQGSIFLKDKIVSNDGKILISPQNRRLGMAFQDLALWPHLRVADHVRFPFEARRYSKKEAADQSQALIDLLGLGHLSARYPHELSGGQQQLVSLGRALAGDPAAVLFDEPFSNLDALQKRPLIEAVQASKKAVRSAFVYVTHDHRDAFELATRLYILNSGRLQQMGTPQEILAHPANDFVKDFLKAGGVMP